MLLSHFLSVNAASFLFSPIFLNPLFYQMLYYTPIIFIAFETPPKMKFLRKIWKTQRKPVKASYDTYNHEVMQIVTPNLFTGIRSEISKTVLPFLQVSNIKTNTSNQAFLTMSSSNSVFQFSFDNSRNYQFKSSLLYGPILTKVHSIVSHKKEVFNQVETILNSRFYNVCFKLISPTFEASNLIYIINYFTSLSFISCGIEVVGMNNELGLGFLTRIESKNNVCCLNLQRFNTLTASFFKRLFGFLEIGAEIKRSSDNLSYSAGARIKNMKSEVKVCLDSGMNVYFDWNESLTENLRAEFSCCYEWDEFEYGIGITFDG